MTTMAEYYELTFTHKVQDGVGYDRNIEQPIIVKCFISPLAEKSDFPDAFDKYVMIGEMCRKLQEYCKRGDHHDR